MSAIKIRMNTDGTIGVNVSREPVDIRRVGRLIVADEVLENSNGLLFAIMSQIAVVRCEHFWEKRAMEYFAYSQHFQPVEPGVIPPVYQVVIHTVEAQPDSFEFVEIVPVDLSDLNI